MSAPLPHPPPEPSPGVHRPSGPVRPLRHRWALALVPAVVLYAADQVTKALAVASLEPGVPRPLLGEVLQLRLIRNPGAAFSVAEGFTWVFTVVAVVVVCAVLRLLARVGSTGWAVALGLLLAGAAGNLTDRLLRAPAPGRGHVVDFLELPHWPIFNVADSCVVAAAVLIALLGLRGVRLDGTREGRPAGGTEDAGA